MMNPAEFANIAALEDSFWWFRGMRRILFQLLDPLAAARPLDLVLEAGCGTAHLSLALAERYRWRMVPLDLAPEGLAYARTLGATRLVQANIASLPFPTGAFDAVLSMDVIVHFPRGEEHTAFLELARVLKPGGLAIIRVSALDILRSRHSAFAHERQRFTRSRLLQNATAAGLRPLRSTYLNSLLSPLAFAKFRLYEPWLKTPPESGVQPFPPWLDSLFYRTLELEARILGAGINFPAGQSLLLIAQKL